MSVIRWLGRLPRLALMGLLILAAPIARAEEPAGPPAKGVVDGDELSPGDRVKVTIFELIDLPQTGDGKTGETALRSFYQRLDLTGEYSVGLDGKISIPRLGIFEAPGRTISDVQGAIAESFEHTMGRTCEVAITVLERQPVYVMGAARNPGAYKFVPGMLVLHALALAGGLERTLERTGKLIELLRERERQAGISARLRRLLAERARLEAERAEAAAVEVPPRLLDLASKAEAETLIEAESAVLAISRKSYEDERAQAAAAVAAVRREVEAVDYRQRQSTYLVELRSRRLNEIRNLSNKGVVSSPNLTLAKTDLAEMEARSGETSVHMAQAEQRLQQALGAADKIERERSQKLARDLALNLDAVTTAEQDLASARRISETLAAGSPAGDMLAGATIAVYEIVRRRGVEPARTFKADEMTPLQPGDIVRVKLAPEPATVASERKKPSQESSNRPVN